jgi:hypothetical protein
LIVAKGSVLVQVAEVFAGERWLSALTSAFTPRLKCTYFTPGVIDSVLVGRIRTRRSWNWSQLEFCSYLMLASAIEGYAWLAVVPPGTSGHSWAGRWSSEIPGVAPAVGVFVPAADLHLAIFEV